VRYLGVDVSEAVDVAAERFAERDLPADFLQADLLDLPVPDASIDVMFSEGVLRTRTPPAKRCLPSPPSCVRAVGCCSMSTGARGRSGSSPTTTSATS
jgi:hypothetical protein